MRDHVVYAQNKVIMAVRLVQEYEAEFLGLLTSSLTTKEGQLLAITEVFLADPLSIDLKFFEYKIKIRGEVEVDLDGSNDSVKVASKIVVYRVNPAGNELTPLGLEIPMSRQGLFTIDGGEFADTSAVDQFIYVLHATLTAATLKFTRRL